MDLVFHFGNTPLFISHLKAFKVLSSCFDTSRGHKEGPLEGTLNLIPLDSPYIHLVIVSVFT